MKRAEKDRLKELTLKWLFNAKYLLENVVASECGDEDFSKDKQDLKEVTEAHEFILNHKF